MTPEGKINSLTEEVELGRSRASSERGEPQPHAQQLSTPVEGARRIPPTWFRSQTRQTTMVFLRDNGHQGRPGPLYDGERRLGWFVLPPFQRPPVWTQAQQVRFIESALLALPIGVFIYNRAPGTRFDAWLLDGQQRVTAVLAYMADEFPVMGYRFSELAPADVRRWDMTTSFGCMETSLTDEGALRDLYDRLAYGGTPHDPDARVSR